MKAAGIAILFLAALPCATAAAAPAKVAPDATCQKYGAQAFSAWTLGLYTVVGQHFAPDMRTHLPPAVLEEMWANLQGEVGTFKTLGKFTPHVLGGHAVMVAPMEFANRHMVAVFACNAKDQIAGLQVLDPSRIAGL